MMVDPRRSMLQLVTLARSAPDLYQEFLSELSGINLPRRGPRGSPENFLQVKVIAAAYDKAFERAWSAYLRRF